jgi:hypothetical protein
MTCRRFASGTPAAVSLVALAISAGAAFAEYRVSVKNDGVRRMTCPADTCGSIGTYYEGESLVVYETANGWSRVSPYFSAGCTGGESAFVEKGPAECTPENGIRSGEFAEWVRIERLQKVN